MMRCLFLHQGSELYGSDRVLLSLVTEMRQRGFCEPIVVVPEEGPLVREMRAQQIEVHIGRVFKVSREYMSLRGLLKLIPEPLLCIRDINRILAGREVDLVHANSTATVGGAVWATLYRKPLVWHVHEIVDRPRVVAEGFAWLQRWFADHVVAISNMTLENLTRRQPAIQRKSSIIWNGMDAPPPVPEADRLKVRQDLGLDEQTVLVSLLGRINRLKGQQLLLEAAELVRKLRPDLPVKYLVVGNTFRGQEYYLTDFLARRAELGLQETVLHHDFVNNVWPLWAATDVAVVPSTQPEGFGMVAIEAMSMGKPVIAAAHGGVLDIIVQDQTGYLVEPCQAEPLARRIIELAECQSLRERMGEAGRVRVAQEFTIAAQTRKFEALYQRLVGR